MPPPAVGDPVPRASCCPPLPNLTVVPAEFTVVDSISYTHEPLSNGENRSEQSGLLAWLHDYSNCAPGVCVHHENEAVFPARC